MDESALISQSNRVALLVRHAEWLRQMLARRLRQPACDVDDILQDIYLRLAREADADVRRPRAYLATIARNIVRDRQRRESIRAGHRTATLQAASSDTDAVPGLAEQEAAVELTRLITKMPDTYRDVFALSRFRHMTNRQIAEHLGLPIKTVEWRMGKALEYCVRRLKD
jgi:RNA polymerase sigma-70 factor (ECF subfamily)